MLTRRALLVARQVGVRSTLGSGSRQAETAGEDPGDRPARPTSTSPSSSRRLNKAGSRARGRARSSRYRRATGSATVYRIGGAHGPSLAPTTGSQGTAPGATADPRNPSETQKVGRQDVLNCMVMLPWLRLVAEPKTRRERPMGLEYAPVVQQRPDARDRQVAAADRQISLRRPHERRELIVQSEPGYAGLDHVDRGAGVPRVVRRHRRRPDRPAFRRARGTVSTSWGRRVLGAGGYLTAL